MKLNTWTNNISANYFKLIISFFLLLSLQSCETITSIPSKIVQGGSDTIDYVTSVFSGEPDDVSEIKNKDDSENLESAIPPEKTVTADVKETPVSYTHLRAHETR